MTMRGCVPAHSALQVPSLYASERIRIDEMRHSQETTIMNETIKSENEFFAAQIADAQSVAIFLINGNRLQGITTAADEHCLLLEGHVEAKYSGLCLVMKTAIASVVTTASKSPTRADARTLHGVLSLHRQ